jgi:ribose transport system substrate-binding protein
LGRAAYAAEPIFGPTATLNAQNVQDPYRMGYQSVETLIAALQGHPPRPKVFVDVVTVTRANMNEPAIRAVIANYNNR